MLKQRIKDIFNLEKSGVTITVQGWVKTARHSKNVSFLEISDGSTLKGIQVVVPTTLANYENEIVKIGTGTSLMATGQLVDSPGQGQKYELQAQSLTVVGTCDEDYPLQKKRHSFEFLREIAHLRPRTNTIGAVWRVRNATAKAIHQFFWDRGFVYLHTPIITSSDCEGAGQMFRVSTLDAKTPPLNEQKEIDFKKDFFGKQTHLTVSGQLEGEIGALALGQVYTFGPTFRAENSNTSRHLAEFWMVEPEMAFCDIQGNMDVAEEFLKHIFKSVLRDCSEDMEFFNSLIEPTILQTLTNIIESPFERITYTEAVEILLKSNKKFDFPVKWGIDLQSEHERFLAEEHFKKPMIVTDYPKDIKAFYMYCNDDGKTVRAMDILVPKIGEIIGGSQREDRLPILKQRMHSVGLNPDDYWWYLDLRRYGSVPHAGFGLGFERIVQFITGMQNIRDVIPFPRVPGYADF